MGTLTELSSLSSSCLHLISTVDHPSCHPYIKEVSCNHTIYQDKAGFTSPSSFGAGAILIFLRSQLSPFIKYQDSKIQDNKISPRKWSSFGLAGPPPPQTTMI